MNRSIVLTLTLALAASLALASAGYAAAAGGNNPAQKGAHGWACFDVPGLGVHCAPPGGPFVTPLQYFDTTDPGDEDAQFLGTEILIPAHRYHGQPCPQEDADTYTPLDLDDDGTIDVYACHHN